MSKDLIDNDKAIDQWLWSVVSRTHGEHIDRHFY